MPTDEDIRAFWEWFASIAATLAADFGDERLLEELDTRVSALGSHAFSWEIGPGIHQPYALALSPDGDAHNLAVTKHIVSMGPSLPGWELHAAKQPKRWDLQFRMQLTDQALDVDARRWTYVLYDQEDGTFDVLIAAPDLATVDEPIRDATALTLLDAMLGEEARLAHVRAIEVVEHLPADEAANASKMANFAKHFAQLLTS